MIAVWVVLGFLIGSLVEWMAHRYILHNHSIRQFSHSHYSIHHRRSRKNDCLDTDYLRFPPTESSNGLGEIIFLLIAIVLALPFVFISVWLWISLTIHACTYYYMHRRFHLDPSWGRKWLPWHYDHHMGPDQNCNWGVTNPIFDWLLKTRKPYFNT